MVTSWELKAPSAELTRFARVFMARLKALPLHRRAGRLFADAREVNNPTPVLSAWEVNYPTLPRGREGWGTREPEFFQQSDERPYPGARKVV